jgi:hypothetical protein
VPSRSPHLVEVPAPARPAEAPGRLALFLAGDQLAQRALEHVTRRPETGQLARTSDELVIEEIAASTGLFCQG